MKSGFKKAKSLILQILLLLVLFFVAYILLGRAKLIKLPHFIEDLFPTEHNEAPELSGDGQEIFEYIAAPGNSAEFQSYPEITVENMNTLLNALEPHQNFYWESISETFSSDSSVKINCKSRISGKKYNVEILDNNNNTTKKYVSDGVNTVISGFSSGNTASSVYSSGIFDFYSDAALISIDYFKDTDFTKGSCEIHHVKNEQYNLVSVVYTYDRNGITVKNNYGISLDFGVVLFAECFENDIPVFKQSTVSIYPLTSLDDKLFTIN